MYVGERGVKCCVLLRYQCLIVFLNFSFHKNLPSLIIANPQPAPAGRTIDMLCSQWKTSLCKNVCTLHHINISGNLSKIINIYKCTFQTLFLFVNYMHESLVSLKIHLMITQY